jgi:DNA-binding LytR/AlgR family response regulator
MFNFKFTMMLKTIAIDDEPIALEIIKTLAAEVPFVNLVECFTNPFQAMAYLGRQQVDLIFLDIKMPGISGTDFLKSITRPPMVVFTTAYSEHAVQSFELDAIDYLLKPFSLPRFLKACFKAQELYELRANSTQQLTGGQSLFIKSGHEEVRVNPEDILYAESAGNYVKLMLTTGNLTTRLTMADAEALLPSPSFIRIHRSFLVAARHVTKTDKRSVWLGKVELPIGIVYSEQIDRFIKQNKKI